MTGLRDRIRALSPQDRARLDQHLATQEERVEELAVCQRGMWFVEQLSPHTPAYLVPGALRLRGKVRLDLLQEAVDQLVVRHASLRTTFHERDGVAVQVVHPSVGYLMPRLKLEADEDDLASAMAEVLMATPMDVAQETFRAALVELAPGDVVLGWVAHHLVCDRWSVGVLIEDLGEIYRALVAGAEPQLSPLPTQYLDFAVTQCQMEASGAWSSSRQFWKEELKGAPPAIDIPSDKTRPERQGYHGASLPLSLGEELSGRTVALAHRLAATPTMVVMAVYASVLRYWSGQDEIVVGAPMVLRDSPDLERLVGYFINPLAVRVRVTGEDTFEAVVRRVRATMLHAYEHQDVPFDVVVTDANVTRDLSRSPLFQASLSYGRQPQLDLQLPGVVATPLQVPTHACRFDLELQAFESDNGIEGWFEYDSDVLDKATVARISQAFVQVLDQVCTASDVPVAQLEFGSAAERAETALALSGEVVDWPVEQGWVHEQILRRAAETPDAVAATIDGDHMTYAELDRASLVLAQRMEKEWVVRPGDVVAILQDRSLELVISILAILRAGAAYLPIPIDIPTPRVVHILGESGAKLALVGAQGLPLLEAAGFAPVLAVGDIRQEARSGTVTELEAPEITRTAADPSYVIYTSGSTGTPKGVVNTHGGIRNRLLWMQSEYQLGVDDVVLQKTPYSFDVSVWEFLWPLMRGARMILARPQGHRDPRYLADLIKSEGVTTVHFVPSMLTLFLAEDLEGCTSLRRVITSGEALGRELQDAFLSRSHAQLHNLYGPTEAAIDVTAWPCVLDPSNRRSVPIGRPIANTRLAIVDTSMRQVPRGIAGELCIAGDNLALGYVNRPETTAERFVDSAAMGERCYRTGDLVRLREDGQIEYCGRLDHQVKIRGLRIELGEIETALLGHQRVHEAAVITHEFTPGDVRLLAYVVPDGAEPNPVELRGYLRGQLPDYMVPNDVHVLAELPLTANGKLDRSALPREMRRSRVVTDVPQGKTETHVAALWEELLGVPVGRHDNFFDAGGHSLMLAGLRDRLQPLSDHPINVVDLFQNPTVATQAAFLRNEEIQSATVSTAARRAQQRKQIRRAGLRTTL